MLMEAFQEGNASMWWEIGIGQDPWGMIYVFYGEKEFMFVPDEPIKEVLNQLQGINGGKPLEHVRQRRRIEGQNNKEKMEDAVLMHDDNLLSLLLPDKEK